MLAHVNSLEGSNHIQLQDIDCERRSINLPGAVPAHSERGVRNKGITPAHVVTLGIAATEPEVGVGERIDHRITLDATVADVDLPCISLVVGNITKRQALLHANDSRFNVLSGPC